eukprot:1912078-Amphidinium_carterae.1
MAALPSTNPGQSWWSTPEPPQPHQHKANALDRSAISLPSARASSHKSASADRSARLTKKWSMMSQKHQCIQWCAFRKSIPNYSWCSCVMLKAMNSRIFFFGGYYCFDVGESSLARGLPENMKTS